MSDTGSPSSSRSLLSKLSRCLLVVVLGLVAFGLYAGYAVTSTKAPAPHEFPPFRYRPLEKSYLTAKFELNSLPARLLGGPTEIRLNERELNALLFGEAQHTDDGLKARVLIEGDRLRVQYSSPVSDTPQPEYYNVDAVIRVSAGPETINLALLEGKIGAYTLGPVTRPVIEERLRTVMNEKYKHDSRLHRIRAMSVESGQVVLTYKPRER